jgi:prefoldin subunit 5
MYDFQRGYLAGLNAARSNAYWRWSVQQQNRFWMLHQYQAFRTPFWNLSPVYHPLVLWWSPNYWGVFFNWSSGRQRIVLGLSPRQNDIFWGWNNFDHWNYYFNMSSRNRDIIWTMTISEQRLFWMLSNSDRRYVLGLNPMQRRNLLMLPEPFFWQVMSWPSSHRTAMLSMSPSNARMHYILNYGQPRTSFVYINFVPVVFDGRMAARTQIIESYVDVPIGANESVSREYAGIPPELREAYESALEALNKVNASIERLNDTIEDLNDVIAELDELRQEIQIAREYAAADWEHNLEIVDDRLETLEEQNDALIARIAELEEQARADAGRANAAMNDATTNAAIRTYNQRLQALAHKIDDIESLPVFAGFEEQSQEIRRAELGLAALRHDIEK